MQRCQGEIGMDIEQEPGLRVICSVTISQIVEICCMEGEYLRDCQHWTKIVGPAQ